MEMPDGAVLLADLWRPGDRSGPLPTVLLRSPYGRSGPAVAVMARPLAEQGFQVLVQSCRGTFGSSGRFEPFRHERRDGLATIEWVGRQPWFNGDLILFGASYLGYVQWAVCDALPSYVKAIIPMVTSSNVVDVFHRS